jgi:hypothetical protein
MGKWFCGLNFSYGIYRLSLLTSTLWCPSSRSWEFLLDLGSCSWWPRLSCFWPLPLYFAANASAAKVTTTHCPPREQHGAGTDPCLGMCGSPPPPTPLTKHVSCLMCPIELHSVRMDAVISGTSACLLRPQVWSPGHGEGKADVGRACPTEPVSADPMVL